MTANQVVAANLRRIRLQYGLTQEQAAAFTAPYLPGGRWSRVVWSAAERSVSGKRVRQFDADEIVGLALGLGVSIADFFLPPAEPELRQIVGVGAEKGADPTRLRQLAAGDAAAQVEVLGQAEAHIDRAKDLISRARSEPSLGSES